MIQEAIKKATKALKKEQKSGDTEGAHLNADKILCELLTELGCEKVVKEFEKVSKWYA